MAEENKVSEKTAIVIECLGKKLWQIARDPDPEALQEANKQYNCSECDAIKTCAKLLKSIVKINL